MAGPNEAAAVIGQPRASSAGARHQTGVVASRRVRAGFEGGRQAGEDAFHILRRMDVVAPRGLGRTHETLDAIRAVRDLDPQVGDAIFVLLRLMNGGHDLVAIAAGSQERVHARGQAALDDLARRVGSEYGGGLDALLLPLSLDLLTCGATAAEVAPNEAVNDVEDWYPILPSRLQFGRNDAGRLVVGLRASTGAGRFEPLPAQQVFYIPLDPETDDPYGRPMLASAVQAALAKAQLLEDLRAYAHRAGTPHIAVSVVWDSLIRAAPAGLREAEAEPQLYEWAHAELREIASRFASLATNDTIVHFDYATTDVLATGATYDFGELEKILTRQLTAAVKVLPALLGINETMSETHGTVQWSVQVEIVEALQRSLKRLVEKLATASLVIKGIPAYARLTHRELRKTDRLFEAQAAYTEARTWGYYVEKGWASNDEAAQDILGHPAFGEPVPPLAPPRPEEGVGAGVGSGGPEPTGDNPGTTVTTQTTAPRGDRYAWELLFGERAPAASRLVRRALTFEGEDEGIDRYVRLARRLFEEQLDVALAALDAAGFVEAAAPSSVRLLWASARATSGEVANEVFGLGYRRLMKGLLRDAVRDGMLAAGVSDPNPPARLIDRIWAQNEKYVLRLRDDFGEAVEGWSRTGGSPADVKAWFDQNAYREELMGRFLAKQGLNAGYAQGRAVLGAARFVWHLGNSMEPCPDCISRDGAEFTLDELHSIGFPGSDSLECKANCHCSLEDVA